MRKILIVPLLLPVLGYAAIQGYYWYQVKAAAERLVQQLEPFGTLRYDSVVAEFSGRAGIKGVRFNARDTGLNLVVEQVTLQSDSWLWFLEASRQQLDEVMPGALALHLDGLQLDLAQLKALPAAAGDPAELLGCEKAGSSGVAFWRALGYDPLRVNIDAGYRFNPQNGYLTSRFAVALPSAFTLALEGRVATGAPQLMPSALPTAGRLSELSVSVTDDSYNGRRARYCAERYGESVAAYVNRHVALLSAYYRDVGLRFGDAVVEGYRQFLLTRGQLELRLVATQPLPFVALGAASLDDFKLAMKVNGKPINPVEVAWQPAEVASETGSLVAAADQTAPRLANLNNSSPQAAPNTTAEPLEQADWLNAPRGARRPSSNVAIDQLSDHVGAKLQIDTLNGRHITGVLDSIARNQLRLKQELEGGIAILPIRFDLIQGVKRVE